MLELYSLNVEVAENDSMPLNNITIAKGNTAIHSAPATVQLNKKGIYMVSFTGSITPTTAGVVSVQLVKDGVAQIGAVSESTGVTTGPEDLSFTTLVQVKEDNTCSCATGPTTVQVVNTGEAGTFTIVRLVVTKVC